MRDPDEDWPDRSTRETRAEFIARMRPFFPKAGDPFDAELEKRTKAALASANEYHASRDPRSTSERLGYGPERARWTAGGEPDDA